MPNTISVGGAASGLPPAAEPIVTTFRTSLGSLIAMAWQINPPIKPSTSMIGSPGPCELGSAAPPFVHARCSRPCRRTNSLIAEQNDMARFGQMIDEARIPVVQRAPEPMEEKELASSRAELSGQVPCRRSEPSSPDVWAYLAVADGCRVLLDFVHDFPPTLCVVRSDIETDC